MASSVERVTEQAVPEMLRRGNENQPVADIAALAVAARDPVWVTNPTTGERRLLDRAGGVLLSASRVATAQGETLESLADLIALDGVAESVVFVGPDAVRVVFDWNGERSRRAVLPLAKSECYGFGVLASIGQRDLVKLLRRVWRDRFLPGDLAHSVSELTFLRESVSGSSVEKTRDSVKGSVRREVASAGAVPDVAVLRTVVFDVLGGRGWEGAPVPCTVEVNLNTEKVEIVPEPGAVRRALGMGMSRVAEELRALLAALAPSGPIPRFVVGAAPDLVK